MCPCCQAEKEAIEDTGIPLHAGDVASSLGILEVPPLRMISWPKGLASTLRRDRNRGATPWVNHGSIMGQPWVNHDSSWPSWLTMVVLLEPTHITMTMGGPLGCSTHHGDQVELISQAIPWQLSVFLLALVELKHLMMWCFPWFLQDTVVSCVDLCIESMNLLYIYCTSPAYRWMLVVNIL